MQQPWQFLSSESALAGIEGSTSADALLAPLEELGLIRVAGPDAVAFLQAQLTQAVDDLDSGESGYAGWCSAKGRVLALFRVLRMDDDFRLLLPRALVADTLKRLRLFVLRAQVAVEDESDTVGVLGVAGTAAGGLLAESTRAPPATPGAVTSSGDLQVIRLPDPDPRYLVLAPGEQVEALWHSLGRGMMQVEAAVWHLLDIRAGLPQITTATRERFVPQMLNLESLGGLSYGKGCYPGQEVVARMHYLGRLKRRLFRVSIIGDIPPAPGTAVRDPEGREQGEVVSAAATPEGGVEALAVLRIDAAASGLVVDGRLVSELPLPYPPPEAGDDDAE